MAVCSEVVYSCASTCACVIELAEVRVCHRRRESRLAVCSHSRRQVSSSPADSHTSLCVKRWMACLYITVAVKKKTMKPGYLLISVLSFNDHLGPDMWVKVPCCLFSYSINHNLDCCKRSSPLSVLCCFCARIFTSEHDAADSEFKSFLFFLVYLQANGLNNRVLSMLIHRKGSVFFSV